LQRIRPIDQTDSAIPRVDLCPFSSRKPLEIPAWTGFGRPSDKETLCPRACVRVIPDLAIPDGQQAVAV